MSTPLHDNATTTPRIRRYIQESDKGTTRLARELGLSETTVRKWKRRRTMEDGSHRPHRIPTTMAPETKAVLVELRELFLLPVDDLLRVGRDFLDPSLSRAALPEAQPGQ